jgi:hypothetical protein
MNATKTMPIVSRVRIVLTVFMKSLQATNERWEFHGTYRKPIRAECAV